MSIVGSYKELESFSYSIAHDLHTPLRCIMSFTQILKENTSHKINEDDINHLDRVIRASAHMANLIDNIPELYRLS